MLAALLKCQVIHSFSVAGDGGLSAAESDTMTVRVEVVVSAVKGKGIIAWLA